MRAYFALSATVFGIVAVLHLLRSVFGWQAQIGAWVVPMWVSWGGLVVAFALCFWGLVLWKGTGGRQVP